MTITLISTDLNKIENGKITTAIVSLEYDKDSKYQVSLYNDKTNTEQTIEMIQRSVYGPNKKKAFADYAAQVKKIFTIYNGVI